MTSEHDAGGDGEDFVAEDVDLISEADRAAYEHEVAERHARNLRALSQALAEPSKDSATRELLREAYMVLYGGVATEPEGIELTIDALNALMDRSHKKPDLLDALGQARSVLEKQTDELTEY